MKKKMARKRFVAAVNRIWPTWNSIEFIKAMKGARQKLEEYRLLYYGNFRVER
jgi:hypothetical protein